MNTPTSGSAGGAGDSDTRLIAMGGAALMEGFSLIGFKTRPDATADDVEDVLRDLMERRQRALIFLEPGLARSDKPMLNKVRTEGGRIVVVEVPPLQTPGDYHPEVEDLVVSILGAAALEAQS